MLHLLIADLKRVGHFPLAVADGSQRQRATEQLARHLFDRPTRAVHERRQITQGGRKPRAGHAFLDRLRDRSAGAVAAMFTGAGIALMLGHYHRPRRQLRGLMTMAKPRAGPLIKGGLTMLTALRNVLDYLIDLFESQQLAMMTLMAG